MQQRQLMNKSSEHRIGKSKSPFNVAYEGIDIEVERDYAAEKDFDTSVQLDLNENNESEDYQCLPETSTVDDLRISNEDSVVYEEGGCKEEA